MKSRKQSAFGIAVMVTMLLSLTAGIVIAAPLTPEMAAKVQVTRKQNDQRITQDKKKAAAEALKAERVKIHAARQAAGKAAPLNISK